MKFFPPRKAHTRIALLAALVSLVFLTLLGLGVRYLVRSRVIADIDEGLRTLAIAMGSDYELEGLAEVRREALRAGLEANTFEFRLPSHSAILFSGPEPFELSGDLLRLKRPVSLEPYRNRPETPYTAVEPYSGQHRVCRFLVVHLRDKAEGATLVIFRSIDPTLRALSRLDRILAWYVLFGFLGTALILAAAVRKAMRPVEEVTRLAERVQASDLSGRVRVRSGGEEFRRLADVINALLERLERAFVSQRRLVADAAHELKTPIAVLVGEAQDALRPEDGAGDRRRSLETIEKTARGLAREVDNLLLLARGDAAPAPRQDVEDLAEIVRESMDAAAVLGATRGVRFDFSAEPGTSVRGDGASLSRLATNLLSNAALYTEPETEIAVSVTARGDEVRLEVRDRGPGVPDEDRSRIFSRFVRLDAARDRNPEGSGLGLAIVEQVALAHGGRVEVEAREGGGALFRAVFPAAR